MLSMQKPAHDFWCSFGSCSLACSCSAKLAPPYRLKKKRVVQLSVRCIALPRKKTKSTQRLNQQRIFVLDLPDPGNAFCLPCRLSCAQRTAGSSVTTRHSARRWSPPWRSSKMQSRGTSRKGKRYACIRYRPEITLDAKSTSQAARMPLLADTCTSSGMRLPTMYVRTQHSSVYVNHF